MLRKVKLLLIRSRVCPVPVGLSPLPGAGRERAVGPVCLCSPNQSKHPSRRPAAGQREELRGLRASSLPLFSPLPRVSRGQMDWLTDVGPAPAVSQRLWTRHGGDEVGPMIGGGGRGSALPTRGG